MAAGPFLQDLCKYLPNGVVGPIVVALKSRPTFLNYTNNFESEKRAAPGSTARKLIFRKKPI
jgi:hypothetical protein